jgi:hypothetical protein
MALWDKSDLLARCVRDSRTPSTTTFPASADWYAWLTDAESLWKPKLAGRYPNDMWSAPTLMTSSDSGVTYSISGETAPLAIEVYAGLTGPRLRVGQFDDSNADYVWELSQIRMVMNTPRTFAAGPYCRYVSAPGTIDASTDSTMFPSWTRRILVARALISWARASEKDAAPFEAAEIEMWGQMEEALKQSNVTYGDAANRGGSKVRGIGYLRMRGG